jgi:hypothetical protein
VTVARYPKSRAPKARRVDLSAPDEQLLCDDCAGPGCRRCSGREPEPFQPIIRADGSVVPHLKHAEGLIWYRGYLAMKAGTFPAC